MNKKNNLSIVLPECSDGHHPQDGQITSSDIQKYCYIIKKQLYRKKLHKPPTSDVVEDSDDHFQNGMINLWQALKSFDASRGMKLTSYLEMNQHSRFGNFVNKRNRKGNQTSSLTELDGWAIVDGSDPNVEGNSPYSQVSESVLAISGVEDSMAKLIDRNTIRSRLYGLKRELFDDLFIRNLSITEICSKYPQHKYHKIKRLVDSIVAIYNVHCA